MEFTERKELEEMIQQSKSFRQKDRMTQNLVFDQNSPDDDMIESTDQEVWVSYVHKEGLTSCADLTIETLMGEIKCLVQQDEKKNLEIILSDQEQRIKERLVIQELSEKLGIVKNTAGSHPTSQLIADSTDYPLPIPIKQIQLDEVQSELVIKYKINKSLTELPQEFLEGAAIYHKQNEMQFGSLFDKSKGRKSSLLKENFKQNGKSSSQASGQLKRIYFFNSPSYIELRVFKNTTVSDVLRQAIELYLLDPLLEKSLIKYPNHATGLAFIYFKEAYELRLLDDDDTFRADMSFAAIDKNRHVMQTDSDSFVLTVYTGFIPPSKSPDKVIINTIKSLPANKNIIVLEVEIRDENLEESMKTMIQAEKQQTIKDVFEILYRKNKKYNKEEYVAKIKYQQDDEYVEVDLKMPIIQIQSRTITLFKKVWADQGIQRKSISMTQQAEELLENDYRIGPINQSQAFKFEEFVVIKINEKGKRQDRVIGINQFKIHNRKNKPNVFDKFLRSQSGTRNPERLIEDIIDVKVVNQFLYISFVDYGGPTKQKELKFDTLEPNIAKYIESKLNFIRNSSSNSSGQKQKVERAQSLSQHIKNE